MRELTDEVPGFCAQQVLLRKHNGVLQPAVSLDCVSSMAEPASHGKICSLSNAEAIGEAGVVSPGEGDDKLSGGLHSSTDRHSCKAETSECASKAHAKYLPPL